MDACSTWLKPEPVLHVKCGDREVFRSPRCGSDAPKRADVRRYQCPEVLCAEECSLLLVLSSTMPAEDTRFQVKHDHGLRSCRGELVFRDDGVEYLTSHKEDARTWNYIDIQQLGLKERQEDRSRNL